MISIGRPSPTFWVAVLGVVFFAQVLLAAPPGFIILERAEADLDFFQKEFQSIVRSLGPTPEGQRMQTLIERINGLKREIWLAKKLLLLEEAITSKKDKPKVRFMVKQNFDEIIAHVQETIRHIKRTLNVVREQNIIGYRKELMEFLEAYVQGLEHIQTRL